MLFTILFSSIIIPIFILGGTILFLTYKEAKKERRLKITAAKERS